VFLTDVLLASYPLTTSLFKVTDDLPP